MLMGTNANDPRKVLKYFARKDGRVQTHYRPSCLELPKVNDNLIVETQGRAEALALRFANKLSAGGIVTDAKDNKVRAEIRAMQKGGRWNLSSPITAEEVYLAGQCMPNRTGSGP